MNSNLAECQLVRDYYQKMLKINNFKYYNKIVNENIEFYFNKIFISTILNKYSIMPMRDLTIYPIHIKIDKDFNYLASAHLQDSKDDRIAYDLYYGGYMSNDGEYKLYKEVQVNDKDEITKMAEFLKTQKIEFRYDAVPGTKNLETLTDDVFNYLLAHIILEVFNTPAGYYSTLTYPIYAYLYDIYKSYIMSHKINLLTSRSGVKFIALNPVEHKNIFDITYAPWRELYLNIITSNVKRNLLSPVFDISFSSAIFLSDRRNFINPNILSKYDLKTVAPKYIDKLSELDKVAKIDREEGIISRKMERDLMKIFNKARETITNSTLTDRVLVIFQNSFATSFDSYLMAKIHNIPMVNETFNFNIFADVCTFNKYLFEIFHGLYVMHNVLCFTHGDLHANNILIRPWIDARATYKPEHRVLYKVGGKNYCFVPTSNTAQIIDFGRSILGPAHANQIIKKIGIFANTLFYSDQQDQIMSLLEILMPQEVDAIVSANLNYSKMFNISCILDYVAVLKSISEAIERAITNREIKDRLSNMITKVNAIAVKLIGDCITGELDNIKNVEESLISSLFDSESDDDIEKYTFIYVYDASFKVNIKFETLDTFEYDEFITYYPISAVDNEIKFKSNIRYRFRESLYEKFKIEYVYPVI